jgi:hypothetical protein
MEEVALGEMGMTEAQLNGISPRSLFNKLRGHRAAEQMQWERMRIQTFLLLRPYMEKDSALTPQQVIPLPWDNELVQTQKEMAKEMRQRSAALWAKIDALQEEDKMKGAPTTSNRQPTNN